MTFCVIVRKEQWGENDVKRGEATTLKGAPVHANPRNGKKWKQNRKNWHNTKEHQKKMAKLYGLILKNWKNLKCLGKQNP